MPVTRRLIHAPRHVDGGKDEIAAALDLAAIPTTLTGKDADTLDGAHKPTGDIVGTTDTQTLSGKTLTTPVVASLYQDAGKTKLITMPAATDTLATLGQAETFSGVKTFSATPLTDAIAERTGAAGVTIDGLLLKDAKLLGTLTLPAITDTLATLSGSEELDNKTLDASIAKGTWTASGIWTIPAVTLGGTVTLNAQSLNAGAVDLDVATTGAGKGIKATSTQNGTNGAFLNLYHAKSAADNDIPGLIRFTGKDDGGGAETWADFGCQVEDASATTEDSRFYWQTMLAGATNAAMILDSAGALTCDSTITGDAFDSLDDALVLYQGISKRDLDLLCQIGVFSKKDTGSGYMVNMQKFMYLLAGGIYQTRQRLDALERQLADTRR